MATKELREENAAMRMVERDQDPCFWQVQGQIREPIYSTPGSSWRSAVDSNTLRAFRRPHLGGLDDRRIGGPDALLCFAFCCSACFAFFVYICLLYLLYLHAFFFKILASKCSLGGPFGSQNH